jgi:hypothetical protein
MKHALLLILLLTTLLDGPTAFAARPDNTDKKNAKGKDKEAPLIIVPDSITVQASSALGAAVHYEVTVTDNKDPNPSLTCSPISGAIFALGTTLVTCLASDWKDNTSSGSFEVSVIDTIAPVLLLPADIVLFSTVETGMTVNYIASAHDAISGDLEVNCYPVSGDDFPVGNTRVDCATLDDNGNSSEGYFAVLIELDADQTPPELLLPSDLVVEADSPLGAQLTYEASAIDEVDGQVTFNCSPATGSWFSLGETQVVCDSADSQGNTSVASFLVTVEDTQPPVLELPNNVLLTTDAEGMNVQYLVNANDLVDTDVSVVCSPASESWFDLGETPVTCVASDNFGNQSVGQFQVTLLAEVDYTSENGIFTLLWDAPTLRENGESLLQGELYGYRIQVVDFNNGWDEIVVLNDATNTSYVWTSPGSGTYNFAVTAVDAFGLESGPSNSITGVVP